MINIDLIWIILLASYIAVFGAVILFSVLEMRAHKTEEYSFLRNFPYEMVNNESKNSRLYKIFLFIFAGLCFGPLFDIVPNISYFGGMSTFAIIVSIVFGFTGVIAVGIHLFEARFVKVHTFLATLLMAMTFLSNALAAVYSGVTFKTLENFGNGRVFTIILMVFSSIIALGVLALMLNPKLKDWAKLEVKKDGDQVSYARPKVFSLAFTEWLTIFALFAGEIIFFLSLIK